MSTPCVLQLLEVHFGESILHFSGRFLVRSHYTRSFPGVTVMHYPETNSVRVTTDEGVCEITLAKGSLQARYHWNGHETMFYPVDISYGTGRRWLNT